MRKKSGCVLGKEDIWSPNITPNTAYLGNSSLSSELNVGPAFIFNMSQLTRLSILDTKLSLEISKSEKDSKVHIPRQHHKTILS